MRSPTMRATTVSGDKGGGIHAGMTAREQRRSAQIHTKAGACISRIGNKPIQAGLGQANILSRDEHSGDTPTLDRILVSVRYEH
jgi:hypothetical protein